MKSYDIFLSLIIFLIFIGIYIFNIFSIGISNIKKNWPVFRCNPMVMPFAGYFGHDPVQNFSYCIQNMQTSYMGYLLQPTHYIISTIHSMVGGLTTDIDWIRKKISSLVSNIMSIVERVFGLFVNIMIEFQRVFIKLKDTFSKVLGIMVSIIYLIEGGIKTGESVMAGPVGETLKFVCFHPNTIISLENGKKKYIKNIMIDDILLGGSKVLATMNIKGNKDIFHHENSYYSIYNSSDNNYIFVTGSHLIFDKEQNKYIPVRESKLGKKCIEKRSEKMNCLITDDHKIRIGEHVFWDWED